MWITYRRAGCLDQRFFRDAEEFVEWLKKQLELEFIEIVHIIEKES